MEQKIYAAPEIVAEHEAIDNTKGLGGITGDDDQEVAAPGSVGFFL